MNFPQDVDIRGGFDGLITSYFVSSFVAVVGNGLHLAGRIGTVC